MPDFTEDTFKPGYRIDSEEQARKWVLELVEEVKRARLLCDVATVARDQRRAHRSWLLKHGCALGVLQALHRVGKIPDAMAEELHREVLATMAPTVIPFGGV